MNSCTVLNIYVRIFDVNCPDLMNFGNLETSCELLNPSVNATAARYLKSTPVMLSLRKDLEYFPTASIV